MYVHSTYMFSGWSAVFTYCVTLGDTRILETTRRSPPRVQNNSP